MNNVDEVIQVITIGLVVAGFLLNTNRYLKTIQLCKECLSILKDRAAIIDEKFTKSLYKRIYFTMWKGCSILGDNTSAIRYAEKLLQIHRESGERLEECKLTIYLARMSFLQSKYAQAKKISEKALLISREIGHRGLEAWCYKNLGAIYESVDEYEKAREHLQKSLAIMKEIGNIHGEASCYRMLGKVYRSVGEYAKAREHLQKSLAMMKEIGDRNGEASCYRNLGCVYQSLDEYEKAREHLEKSLSIIKETGDIHCEHCESKCYINLGNVYRSVGQYEKARDYLEKSLAINKKIGDLHNEVSCYTSLGNIYRSVGEYEKARKHLHKSLAINKQIGNIHGEASCYSCLGNVYQSVGEYEKAREHILKSLSIAKEIGDRNQEANCYTGLGNVFQLVGESEKAREHHQKSLAIYKEIGSRKGEAVCYRNLGGVYHFFGEYEQAREHHQKSLAIYKEIGDKDGEAGCYQNLGTVYASVGEYEKASYYLEKSLAISGQIGTRHTLALSYSKLGDEFRKFGNYRKANEYNKKALAILTDIGDEKLVATVYMSQGWVECAVGACNKGKEYFEKALAISKEIGNKSLEAKGCSMLGRLFLKLAQYSRAEEYLKNGLKLSEETGHIKSQFNLLELMADLRMSENNIQEAISYFLSAIEKCEEMRRSLRDNDQFKISFSDCNIRSYRELSKLLCQNGNTKDALYVSELSRARALADLMSARYSVENKIAANPRTWAGIESIAEKGCNRTCLYISYCNCSIYLWIVKGRGVTYLQENKADDIIAQEGLKQHLGKFFDFRSFGILPEELCEDRSLHCFQPESKSHEEGYNEGWRIGNESKDNQGPKMNLPICYKLIIAPVMKFLEGPEIVIVPDRALYSIPFAALTDESGKYLSETFRIRVVPSLTTLKLIIESPADYHCQTGALIVGNPDVGEVDFKGRPTKISRLPCAEKEARMVGEKLGVEPLLGEQATRQAVLEAMNSVALIHIAAHGDAERGEIALAPSPAFRSKFPNAIPKEGLYLLTMSDISNVQLRAKLVVLSCCHSARGLTKAEGAVGIARAFLGSGARSVLVSLWALDDESTEQFMSHFYDHLVAGESAGESLHEAMKWMRSEGCDVNQWAPFILIGDDVTFDFGEKGKI